jgi:hypothetical protein
MGEMHMSVMSNSCSDQDSPEEPVANAAAQREPVALVTVAELMLSTAAARSVRRPWWRRSQRSG